MHMYTFLIQKGLNYTYCSAPCFFSSTMSWRALSDSMIQLTYPFTQLHNIPWCDYTLVYVMGPLLISTEVVAIKTNAICKPLLISIAGE